jgi:hypothetical protein
MKLLDKATIRTYTSTSGFATIVFTLQTAALAFSDSYGTFMERQTPTFATLFDKVQSLLNPDQGAFHLSSHLSWVVTMLLRNADH